MPLHPEIAADLAVVAARGEPPLKELSAQAARARAEAGPRVAGAPVRAVETIALPVESGSIAARLYRPFGDGDALPGIVYIHGGGWVLCSLDTHDNICRNLAASVGAVVVSIDYRMAPEHRFPVASDDCLAAVRWVAGHASGLGIDPARLILGGDSAGGNLSAVTALRIRDEGGPALAGEMLLYPVTDDIAAGHPSYGEFADGFGLTADDMAWFWDHYVPDPAERGHPHASPLRAESLAGLPPTLLLTAGCDVLRDEGEAYAGRLAAVGVTLDFRRYEGLHHGCAGDYGRLKAVAPFFEHVVAWARAIFRL
ncbi:Lipolytic enzyme [uncultured Pleomorphomonas sp.]|uniref:Lipolytic enzyme n=1 Tax=uncultured Pleomorphomonas sp. TaxID=442121 RepID=A0A212LLS0_9HYPH|nr:alpha/beta hydrolase [uncultured Pleomorphomonas sp.]SCM78491.1 Lipolytic enzyme [uncultured Pleomorphomonas sp.]